ncbi:hypothetical protein Lal_00023925 [Lupinus albus]|nr:hypothetical protein Lal_00023925 [Lupinus albus]
MGSRAEIVLLGDSITEQSFRDGGWGATLANAYSRKADILVRGYGGYNTKWALFLLHHIFPLGSPKPPIATTIFFGANDAALLGRTSERQHVPIEDYKQNLRKIVLHLKAQSSSTLWFFFFFAFCVNFCNWLRSSPFFVSLILPVGGKIWEYSPSMQIVLITPPPVSEEGRQRYAESLYGENAMKLPERTNEVTGQYAKACVEIAKEMSVWYINLWPKMQETDGWQDKFLSDGLHLTPEGNTVVYQEVIKVFNEAGLSADKMPLDFPHHSQIDGKNPEIAFQQQGL